MGFPNKTLYPEFKSRYNIIAAQAVAKAKNDKAAAQVVMDVVKMDKEKYRLGHTKVFFRAGIAAKLEEAHKFKVDFSSRAGSIYGSRPTSPYNGGTLTRAGGKTNTLQSQPSNASSYNPYATTTIPMQPQQPQRRQQYTE